MSKAATPSEPRTATTVRPSVTGVEFAWLDFTWRVARGTPECTSFDQSSRAVPGVEAQKGARCATVLSLARPMPPVSPRAIFGGFSRTTEVTKTLSPHTTGLECPWPGIAAFQRMLRPVLMSHSAGRSC